MRARHADVPALLRDRGIKVVTRDKHVSAGWIGLPCPFCEDRGAHLGWNIAGAYFSCWKCGWHPAEETVAALLGVPLAEASDIMRQYDVRPSRAPQQTSFTKVAARPTGEIVVPGGPLGPTHRRYLEGRGYDPDELARLWGLTGTGPVGRYKFRVMYPIYFAGRVVSYQGRDVTGRSDLRWKACRAEDELRDHKACLGGAQLALGQAAAVVEGATDGWRLGPGAVWTFGTAYLPGQVRLLGKYRRVFVVLDSAEKDPNAERQARRLSRSLAALGTEVVMHELESGDPGDLCQADADALMREWNIK